MSNAIHRVIELHAATRGDLAAVVEGSRTSSYRQLNYAANGVARALNARGFRRGGHAIVRMRRGCDLAVVLLAILKAGGSYTWSDPARATEGEPIGVSFRVGTTEREEQWMHVDFTGVMSERVACSPNLPIVTRGTDAACTLQEADSEPVIVPHATIASLCSRGVPRPTPWIGEPGAFDLWIALMAGTTAVVQGQESVVAAA